MYGEGEGICSRTEQWFVVLYCGTVAQVVAVAILYLQSADLSLLPTRGPCSKYEVSIAEGEFRGKLELTFESEPMRVSVHDKLTHRCFCFKVIEVNSWVIQMMQDWSE